MSEIKLLPCPFCGGEVEMAVDSVDAYSNAYTFCCDNCYMYTAYQFSNEKEAIEHWNTRKPMERIKARMDEKMESVDYWTKPYDKYEYYDNGYWEGMNEIATIVKEEGGIE